MLTLPLALHGAGRPAVSGWPVGFADHDAVPGREEQDMRRLSGKNAMVIGDSRGIGAAIVERFAEEGARVTFTFARAEDRAAATAERTGARAVKADSADRLALVAAVKEAGPLDILVANAGIAVLGDPTAIHPDAVDAVFDVNVRAPWHAFVEAARTMPDGGRLIAIGSATAERAPTPGRPPTR